MSRDHGCHCPCQHNYNYEKEVLGRVSHEGVGEIYGGCDCEGGGWKC